jgi:PKD repeat protein
MKHRNLTLLPLSLVILLVQASCSDDEKKVPPAPTADFNFSPSGQVIAGETEVNFTSIIEGKVDNYLWEFGDDGFSTEENPSYTFEDEGRVVVKLTVTGPGGSDSHTKTIDVDAPSVSVQGIVWNRYGSQLGYNTDIAIGNITGEAANRVYMCEHPGSPSAGLYKGYIDENIITWDAQYNLPQTEIEVTGNEMSFYYLLATRSFAGSYRIGTWRNHCDITVQNGSLVSGNNAGSQTGDVVFWTLSDFGCGNITVSIDGYGTKILTKYFSSGAPSCGVSGAGTFSLPAGTYNYTASCSKLTWSGTVTSTTGNCFKLELTSNGGGEDEDFNPYGVWQRYSSPIYNTDIAVGNIPGEASNRVYMCEHPGSPTAGLYKGYINGNIITWDAVHRMPNAEFAPVGDEMTLYYGVGDRSQAGKYKRGVWTETCGKLKNNAVKIAVGLNPDDFPGNNFTGVTIEGVITPLILLNSSVTSPDCSSNSFVTITPQQGDFELQVKISYTYESLDCFCTKSKTDTWSLSVDDLDEDCNVYKIVNAGGTLGLGNP